MLKNILDSLIPENIKNIDLIKDAIDIFIENIEKNSEIAIDIKKILNPEDEFSEDYKTIKDTLLKLYLNDLYNTISQVQKNDSVLKRIDKYITIYQLDENQSKLLNDVELMLNFEHFIANKAFKQKKGTKAGIEYIYNLVDSLNNFEDEKYPFTLIENKEFDFSIQGSIVEELYNLIVKPISHPLGFTYTYTQIVLLMLQDYFNIEFIYKNVEVEVRCLFGNTLSFDGSAVVNIIETEEDGKKIKRVYFDNGEVLEQKIFPIDVTLYNSDGSIKNHFDEHCSLFLKYDIDVKILTEDELLFRVDKTLYDFFWDLEGIPARIGNELIIGEFKIGGWERRYIQEELNKHVKFFATKDNTSYQFWSEDESFVVGTSIVGERYIGKGPVTVQTDTSEYYDIRNAEEEFSITTI